MVDTIALTKRHYLNGLQFSSAGHNEDGDKSATLDMESTANREFLPSSGTLVVTRTVGATNTADVDLDGSEDGTTWFTLATVTNITGGVGATSYNDQYFTKFRTITNTVGAGNTLTETVNLVMGVLVP